MEGGDEKEMARLMLWWRLFLSSFGLLQGSSLALKNHVFHVFSLPGGGVAGGRQDDGEAGCLPPLLPASQELGEQKSGPGTEPSD